MGLGLGRSLWEPEGLVRNVPHGTARHGHDLERRFQLEGGTVPGSGDLGLFSAASYNSQPYVDAASSLGGIWNTGAGAVTIDGTNALTLYGTTINGNAGTGVEMDAGAGPLTINARSC